MGKKRAGGKPSLSPKNKIVGKRKTKARFPEEGKKSGGTAANISGGVAIDKNRDVTIGKGGRGERGVNP